jgi:hypothetical protein
MVIMTTPLPCHGPNTQERAAEIYTNGHPKPSPLSPIGSVCYNRSILDSRDAGKRSVKRVPTQSTFNLGDTDMADKGKRDKGKKEQQKTAKLNPKEKRKQKKEKKK